MYTEQDLNVINARIRKNWLVLGPILAALLAGYIYALSAGIEWLAMVLGALLFVAACYGLLAYLIPNMRYRGFLLDMEAGLSRDVRGTIVEISGTAELHVRGTIVEISGTPELQDGAMVLPVRVKLDPDQLESAMPVGTVESKRLGLESQEDTEDERIVYLNTAKRAMLPGPGTEVVLHCYGRHIKSVEC